MRKLLGLIIVGVLTTSTANATVFLNEIFINPSGSDDNAEYIELLGTPGRSLDGYAIAQLAGTQRKYWPLGTMPPSASLEVQEIDEFYSLDGLSLGANGLLVIHSGPSGGYPRFLDDTHNARWTTLWNGGLDTVGKLENDGSATFVLIRNRPGRTEADPTNPAGLRWGKDIRHDDEVFTPAEDPQDPGVPVDQYGNGAIDKGNIDDLGRETLDLRGYLTLADVSDDLEIVDEVSYEHDRGWEYDLDSRAVDAGSVVPGLPERKVHALDDPQGFNPDCLTRVDYRTKGDGWVPAAGATGGMPNGNNWQDTATEQWIRGESVLNVDPVLGPLYYFDNAANSNEDAVQPYETNVPLWLDDATGVDYDFTTLRTYEIKAGQVNPLATPFIPGDVDRDGDCDQEDIDKIAAVFGDADWIFSNSFAEAPEGKDGDPATQTRPWDVDATGTNGIEPSDLQWTLNFQGNTDGRIVGVEYDETGPAAGGVVLNPNTGVEVTFTAELRDDRDVVVTSASTGQTVWLYVYAEVTGGANATPGEENGVMQFAHDLAIDTPGVVSTNVVGAVSPFHITRFGLVSYDAGGGFGAATGYTDDFTVGLDGPALLYFVPLTCANAPGAATMTLSPASQPQLAAGAPHGVKVGHTAQNGDPESVVYPGGVTITVEERLGDLNCDGVVDFGDINPFVAALGGESGYDAAYPYCNRLNADVNGDGIVDFDDINPFVAVLSGGN